MAGITDYTGLVSQLNQLPAGRIDPNAIKLLGVYPAATSAGLANNFYWEPKQPTNINSYDIRIDEAINASNVVFGVFDRSLYSVDVPSSLPGLAVGETGGRHDSFPSPPMPGRSATRTFLHRRSPMTCTSAWCTPTSYRDPFTVIPSASQRASAFREFRR